MSPSWKEAEGTDGQKKILPMKSSMEDAGKNDWHDQQDDDGVEDEPGQEQTSFPQSEAAQGQNVGGQGQRSEDANEDACKNDEKWIVELRHKDIEHW